MTWLLRAQGFVVHRNLECYTTNADKTVLPTRWQNFTNKENQDSSKS